MNKSLAEIPAYDSIPRNISPGQKQWNYVTINDWTSGFWPGILWYSYESSGDEQIKEKAIAFTEALKPILVQNKWDHDLGFMYYCSYGNGYRITKNPAYKEVLLAAADSLVTLYNPKVGTILSWPGMVEKMNWPHNTIADNMMNLELLFWAAKNGRKDCYDMAVSHAEVTMKNQIRPDNSMYHVAVYDDKGGQFIKGVTHQGYADNSMWARGQSWGIYGFTMCYRETGKEEFLETAQHLADKFIERLPADMVPYWDYDAPNIPDEPKDASAAAITASALLELSTMGDNQELQDKYRTTAERIIASLSSDRYLSKDQNNAFLLHSTGHWPNKSELDVPIVYSDYYFIEALMRLKRLNAGEKVATL
ncbi:glycoside hydrolase family 88 protein [Pontibacter sp. E15-1]|uniref:glycoside hydrolase family 88 protein n=1 Tax=Pontibacter sp. E15-1 TaxID=2919918 RepID=UPI001F500F58|nr:glycoside hydrolase family 88 protein [Pontibacter sp. E15-1]MCJ8164294.1 glycoside hydrolase family 88 protein [Pontibacter sp. E15-1]